METELWMLEESPLVNTHPDTLKATLKKNQTGKSLVKMAYTDFGLKISPLYTTDLLPKGINAYRKLNIWIDDQKGDHSDPKRPLKRTTPNNYRPITCLLMMWKILMAQTREKIFNSLISRRLFPEEQKGCCKRTRGTEKLLYIDQHTFNKSKMRQKKCSYCLDWLQKGLLYGSPKLDTTLSQNV